MGKWGFVLVAGWMVKLFQKFSFGKKQGVHKPNTLFQRPPKTSTYFAIVVYFIRADNNFFSSFWRTTFFVRFKCWCLRLATIHVHSWTIFLSAVGHFFLSNLFSIGHPIGFGQNRQSNVYFCFSFEPKIWACVSSPCFKFVFLAWFW